MKAVIYDVVLVAALAVPALACAPTSPGGCGVSCPVGCNVSADCSTCVPVSFQAGLGTSCSTDSDCCTGSCLNGICTGAELTTAGGSNSGGAAGGSTTAGHGSTSSAAGTTGGASSGGKGSSTSDNGGSCPASSTPSPTSDAACGNTSLWVCSPSGICVANCNGRPAACGIGQVCEVNGHCEAQGGSAGNGSGGGGSAGSGSAGSAGSSAGKGSSGSSSGGTSAGASTGGSPGGSSSAGSSSAGSSSAGSSSGGSSSGGSSSGGSSSGGSSSGGSSSGGSSSGGGGACGGAGQEYAACTKASDCACPFDCVADGSGSNYCLQPCSSYQSCQVYEICDTKLSPASCYPDGCSDGWGACAAGNDTGSQQTGTCNVYADSAGNPYGVCFAGGSAQTGGGCAANATYATAASQQCAVGDFCGSTTAGDSCYQGCDPTGTLTSPGCAGGMTCSADPCDCATDPQCLCSGSSPYCDPTVDSQCDPYFGVCQ